MAQQSTNNLRVFGEFSDFKIIKTRGVCQFIIEVPQENANNALQALGGLPMSGDSRWIEMMVITENSEDHWDEQQPEMHVSPSGKQLTIKGLSPGESISISHPSYNEWFDSKSHADQAWTVAKHISDDAMEREAIASALLAGADLDKKDE